MEAGLHEVMAMAEGVMFRLDKAGDRWAPPVYASQACSVKGSPFWYRICVREDRDGETKACVSLDMRGVEDAPSWELWLDGGCRWDSRLYGGRTLSELEWDIDEAIGSAVAARNGGLGQ